MLRQIARYLPHQPDETDAKIHLKSSENKIKTASKIPGTKHYLVPPKSERRGRFHRSFPPGYFIISSDSTLRQNGDATM